MIEYLLKVYLKGFNGTPTRASATGGKTV
jgi:hypothetical protein